MWAIVELRKRSLFCAEERIEKIKQVKSMATKRFNKTILELEANAVMWWPKNLTTKEADTSIVPLLLKTQAEFISILNIAPTDIQGLFKIIAASKVSANVFLKHLVVLSDYGGEQIQRLNINFKDIFPQSGGRYFFEYYKEEKKIRYIFKALPVKGALNNKRLLIDGPSLTKDHELSPIIEDLIALLMFGSSAVDDNISSILNKCEIGTLVGDEVALSKYVKQKYIWVSRITGGAAANTLGQIAQTYARDYLRDHLPKKYEVVRNGHISIVSDNDDIKPLPFDIVVMHKEKKVGVEVSFQVTTNSTIERKAGQAQSRQALLHRNGDYIAYIIDGAGNFQRKSAIKAICKHSDCTVAYSDEEFQLLVDFIASKLK